MTRHNAPVTTVARIVTGLCFLAFPFTKLIQMGTPDDVTAYIAHVGLPFPPLAFWFSVTFECVAGFLLIFGVRTQAVFLALAGWCVITALIFHHDLSKRAQRDMFTKNIVIAAAFVQLARRRPSEA